MSNLAESRPITANGIIRIDGLEHPVRLHRELLVLDAVSWFRSQRDKWHAEAERGRAVEDYEFAKEMDEVAHQLTELLAAQCYIPSPGLFPQLENRAKMPLWELKTCDDIRQYGRHLLQVSCGRDDDCDEFLMDVDADPPTLTVSPGLRFVARHSGIVAVVRVI